MRRILSVLILCLFCLSGCGKDVVIDTTTQIFEIPMKDDLYCRLELPGTWTVTKQDAFHYWQFNNTYDVYKIQTKVSVGEQKNNCYYSDTSVSRNFEEGTIILNAEKEYIELLGMYLDSAEIVKREVPQYRELEVDYLPDYVDLPMELTNNGLYMPVECEDVTSTAFTAASSMKETSFVTSWIMKSKLDGVKPLLHNLAVCNSGEQNLDWWYQTDDIYFVSTKDKVACAKKLTYNQWCCYVASKDNYMYYPIKAMFNIE